MGLDMYLYASKYASEYTEEDVEYPQELCTLENMIIKRNFVSKNTHYQIGYWRKFNALHKWFVENCANGEDDCRPVYVDREDLSRLLNLLKVIKLDHTKAKELLPTERGFFFGSTEFDDWYFEEIEYTIKLLTEALKTPAHEYSFYYEASW